MNSLEQLAKELFERFAKQQGKSASWAYLSADRKLTWMEDVLLIAEHLLVGFRNKVKPYVPSNGVNTLFVMGQETGRQVERTNMITLVEDTYDQFYNDYDSFKQVNRIK